MPPKVSVNICCYNSEKYIKETIQSVLDQTFKDLEIIIVDDGSKDRTGEIIRSFNDPRIHYYFQENRGLSSSRNRAIELSAGEYIALLDHDDLWEKDKLDKQVLLYESNPHLGLVYSDCFVNNVNNKEKNIYSKMMHLYRGNVLGKLFYQDFIPLFTILMKKEVAIDVGKFDERYRIVEDYEYLIRLAGKYEIDYVPLPLGTYLIHAGNTIKNKMVLLSEQLAILNQHKYAFNMISEAEYNDRRQRLRQKIAFVNILKGNVSDAKNDLRNDLSAIGRILYLCAYLPNWFIGPIFNLIYNIKIDKIMR